MVFPDANEAISLFIYDGISIAIRAFNGYRLRFRISDLLEYTLIRKIAEKNYTFIYGKSATTILMYTGANIKWSRSLFVLFSIRNKFNNDVASLLFRALF